MKLKYLSILILCLAFACKQGEQSSESETNDTARHKEVVVNVKVNEFKESYKEFFYSIIDGKPEKFNNYIHPDFGLYLIESNGAIPKLTNVKDITKFERADKKSFFDFDRSKVGYELIEEELPKIDCDKGPEFYSKQGCFTQAANPLSSEQPWSAIEMKKEDKQKMQELSETVMITVINTSNYKYYFSQLGGKWYVTFIDVRKPCNA